MVLGWMVRTSYMKRTAGIIDEFVAIATASHIVPQIGLHPVYSLKPNPILQGALYMYSVCSDLILQRGGANYDRVVFSKRCQTIIPAC